jgi:hypothetical protein
MGMDGKPFRHLEYFTALGNLVAIWYIFPRFGTLSQEKSGNPELNFFLTVLRLLREEASVTRNFFFAKTTKKV